ncbi:MAG TPA: hypothetical protein VGJ64_01245 [Gemmatimonadaceae bacterium]|jgi:hypothetical protein
MPVVLLYAGLTTAVAGLLSLLRPIRWLGIPTRLRAGKVFVAGALIAVVAARLPAQLIAQSAPNSLLDGFVPRYQFNEVHSIDVHASPESVYAAIRQVTASEIRFFRVLTWIRSPHIGPTRESILNPAAGDPMIDVATRSGFLLLAEAPPHELVFGTIGFGGPLAVSNPTPQGFRRFDRPGYAKIAMNFLVTPAANGSARLGTETRVYATDDAARRGFATYWRLIYPGSSLIRIMWLRAIRARAER